MCDMINPSTNQRIVQVHFRAQDKVTRTPPSSCIGWLEREVKILRVPDRVRSVASMESLYLGRVSCSAMSESDSEGGMRRSKGDLMYARDGNWDGRGCGGTDVWSAWTMGLTWTSCHCWGGETGRVIDEGVGKRKRRGSQSHQRRVDRHPEHGLIAGDKYRCVASPRTVPTQSILMTSFQWQLIVGDVFGAQMVGDRAARARCECRLEVQKCGGV